MSKLASILAAAALTGAASAPAAAQYPYGQYPGQYPPGYYGNQGTIGAIIDSLLGNRYSVTDRGAVRLRDRLSREVAVTLIRAIYGQRYTDLGGFRAIRLPALVALGMSEQGRGWNVEMQVKAVKAGLRVAEVPVRFRRRADGPRPRRFGETALASSKMLYTILRHSTTR